MQGPTEIERTVPQQEVFVRFATHNHDGVRLIPLLGAGANWDSLLIQIRGYTDLEIFNFSDQQAFIYVFLGVSPLLVLGRIIGEENVMFAYNVPSRGETYRYPCRAEYAQILYSNFGLAAQTTWEFQLQFRPIGRS